MDWSSNDQVVAPATSSPANSWGATDTVITPSPSASASSAPVAQPQQQSLLQRINDAGNDFGDAFIQNVITKPVVGAAQLVGHGMTAAADAILPESNSVRQMIDNTSRNADASISAENAQYQKDVPDNWRSYAGAALGNVVPFLLDAPAQALDYVGNAAKVLPESSTLAGKLGTYGNKILSGAAQGTAVGALQPIENTSVNGHSYASQKLGQVATGAEVGGAIPGFTNALSAGYQGVGNALANVFNPEGVAANNLGRTLQATPETLNALSNYASPVPGVKPTTAQVVGGPRAVMVEKAAANTPEVKEALTENQNANNAARLQVLQSIAGSDEDLSNAINARRDMANSFTQANLQPGQNPIDPTDLIRSLSTLQAGTVRPAIKNGANDILSTLRGAMNPDGTIDAGLLDDLRQNANDYLAKHSPGGIVPSQVQAALGPIKQQITQTLGQNVAGYGDYLANYAKLSQPINDMASARAMLAPSNNGALNTAGDNVFTLNNAARGIRADDLATYGMSPEARAQIEAVQQSLKQESMSNSIRSPGSDTNYNAQAQGWLGKQVMGQGNPIVGMAVKGVLPSIGSAIGYGIGGLEGASFGGVLGAGANSVLKQTAGIFNQRITDAYNKGVIDPDVARGMIAKYLNQNQAQAPALLRQFPAWQSILSGQAASRSGQAMATNGAP